MKVGVEKKAEDNKVSLELEPLKRPVTIEDLMRHTAGIPYGYYGGDLVNKLYADAGNAPFLEQSDRFNRDLAAFLESTR